MKIRFIKTPEKRRILAELKNKFGIETLPYLLIETGKEKIRAFSGSLSKEEISQISRITKIETIGLYFLKKENDFRPSIDALHLLKKQIKKNIIEINQAQLNEWIRGIDLQIRKPRETYAIKHNGDFIGCGKSNTEKVFNHLPKSRRLKKQAL